MGKKDDTNKQVNTLYKNTHLL